MSWEQSLGLIAGAIATAIATYQAARGKATSERLDNGNTAFKEIRDQLTALAQRDENQEARLKALEGKVQP